MIYKITYVYFFLNFIHILFELKTPRSPPFFRYLFNSNVIVHSNDNELPLNNSSNTTYKKN